MLVSSELRASETMNLTRQWWFPKPYKFVGFRPETMVSMTFRINSVEAIKIRTTVVDSGKAASFVDLTHINAFRRGVIVIGNK